MTPPSRISPRALILVVLGLASLMKAGWASWSGGTCDVMFFYLFAEKLQIHPLSYLYANVPLFNHMPLTGLAVKGLFALVAGNYWAFAMILRFACIGADAAVVMALLSWRERLGGIPWWALALFAASPVSIMVSGFHGNVDPIMTALLFFAAAAAWRDRPLLCGLLFALACNVKILPILFSPVFFFFWLHRGVRPALHFFLMVTGIMLLGTAWPLLECPQDFSRQVLGYGSNWGTWGITYWLRLFGPETWQKVDFKDLSAQQIKIMSVLKLIIIAITMTIAWLRRKVPREGLFATLALTFSVMFAFAPGIGVQYMVWCAPFLLLYSPGWYAAVTAGATVFLATFYAASSNTEFPWDSVFPKGPDLVIWGPWANIPWLTFAALLVWVWRRRAREATPALALDPG